jgi:hypothetical protein
MVVANLEYKVQGQSTGSVTGQEIAHIILNEMKLRVRVALFAVGAVLALYGLGLVNPGILVFENHRRLMNYSYDCDRDLHFASGFPAAGRSGKSLARSETTRKTVAHRASSKTRLQIADVFIARPLHRLCRTG